MVSTVQPFAFRGLMRWRLRRQSPAERNVLPSSGWTARALLQRQWAGYRPSQRLMQVREFVTNFGEVPSGAEFFEFVAARLAH